MKLWQRLFSNSHPARQRCAAIVAAAGSSRRMAGENKLLFLLGGKPVLAHALQALDSASCVDELVVAAREGDVVLFAELCKVWGIRKPVKVIVGGETRAESVLRAALETDADLLAIHDGARPFVTPELVDAVIGRARKNLATAPAIPVKDTIKCAVDGVVRETPDRSTLFSVQTPQVFDATLLRAALQSGIDAGVDLTDDCAAVERLGEKVHLIEGFEENIKITTPFDIILAEAILKERGD